MKIAESQVRKISINGLNDFDPIQVYIEDAGAGRGQITIVAHDGTYSRYWSSMGDQHNMSSFFRKASTSYLADKLRIGKENEEVLSGFSDILRNEILKLRRDGAFKKEQARKCWDESEEIENNSDFIDARYLNDNHGDMIYDVFGDDWWHSIPTKKHNDEIYLEIVIGFVKEALDLLEQKTVHAA